MLRRIAARIGLAQRKRERVAVLLWRGTKVTPDAVVDIRRLVDGRIVWLVPDLDDIEALSEGRASLWKRVSEAEFLSDEEKRRLVGLAQSR